MTVEAGLRMLSYFKDQMLVIKIAKVGMIFCGVVRFLT